MSIQEACELISGLQQENRQLRQQLQHQSEQLQYQSKQLREQSEQLKELQERLKKNSTNSSKPPSSDGPQVVRPKKKPTGKKQGAQKGHLGTSRKWAKPEKVDKTIFSALREPCAHCKANAWTHLSWVRRKQVCELPPVQPHITDYTVQLARCQACGKTQRARLPQNAPKGGFGPRAQAAVNTLTGVYGMSRRKAGSCLKDLMGLPISLGSLHNIEQRMSQALQHPAQQVRQSLRQESCIHVDETGHKRAGVRRFTWVMSSPSASAYFVGQRRNRHAMWKLVTPGYAGTLVCDGFSTYNLFQGRKQQCWAHLWRRVKGLIGQRGEVGRVSQQLSELMGELFRLRGKQDKRACGGYLFRQETKRHRQRIMMLLKQSAHLHKQLKTLFRLFWKKPHEVWRFVKDPKIPMTNNQAERDLRDIVLWRKVSQGTRSLSGDRYVERIRTIADTCRKQKQNPFQFFCQALEAHAAGKRNTHLLTP